jgi:exopolysaccharide biosynthesis polyprenyl glycosylphosphotransferase
LAIYWSGDLFFLYEDGGCRMGAPETVAPLYLESEPIRVVPPSRAPNLLFRRLCTLAEAFFDGVACWFGTMASFWLDYVLSGSHRPHHWTRETVAVSTLAAVLVVLILNRDRAYGSGGSLLQIRETERAIRLSASLVFLLLVFAFLLRLSVPAGALAIDFLLLPPVLISEKLFLGAIVQLLHLRGFGVERVAVYGTGDTARRIVTTLLNSPRLGLKPVVAIDDNPRLREAVVPELGYRRARTVPIRSGPLSAASLVSSGCSLLVVAAPNLSPERSVHIARTAKVAGVRVAYLAAGTDQEHPWIESIEIDGLLLTAVSEPETPWHYALIKRIFDVVCASVLLLVLGPILIGIAIWVRLDSPGPALFVQTRVGRNGRTFKMFKFRSMRTDAPQYQNSPTDSADGRITRAGRFLRRVSLDEVPQLLNVLSGDMSLVGPRPEMPFIVECYNERHRQRLQVVPGITGLWQLSADRHFLIHENLQYDLYYIQNRNFVMDLAILIHTAFFAMNGI